MTRKSCKSTPLFPSFWSSGAKKLVTDESSKNDKNNRQKQKVSGPCQVTGRESSSFYLRTIECDCDWWEWRRETRVLGKEGLTETVSVSKSSLPSRRQPELN